ncbi:MAG: TM2 domain-containing protein [Spirochaetaceae bacterium]|nr:TM2 domain-containing protein [Spirochaetaceae bacterium]
MDTEQQAIENTQQQLPANNSGTAQEISPKSRLIAFLLCTFAGYVGAHNFYVGRIRRGIIQLLLNSEQFHRVLLQLAVFGTFKCRQPRCCRCSFCGCIHLPDSHYGCCNLDFCRLDYDSCGSLQRQAETPLEELVGKRLILWEYMQKTSPSGEVFLEIILETTGFEPATY